MYTSQRIEWIWLLGRTAVAGVVLLAIATTDITSQASGLLLGAVGFVVAYSLALAAMLRRQHLVPVFIVGLALDTATVLSAWWAVADAFRGASLTNDLYLVVLPLVTINAIRFPARLTIAYLALFMAWMAWVTIMFYDPVGYDVAQLPVRIALISISVLLLTYFINERRKEAAKRHLVEERMEAWRAQSERERDDVLRAVRTLEARSAETAAALRTHAQQARIILANSTSEADTRQGFAYFVQVMTQIASASPAPARPRLSPGPAGGAGNPPSGAGG